MSQLSDGTLSEPSVSVTPTHAAFLLAQNASQSRIFGALLADGAAGEAAKQINPPCDADGVSAAENAVGAFTSNARLIMRTEIRPRFTINPALGKTPIAARPLVAREFRNRNEMIATAFGREAWTYASRLPARVGREAAFVSATLLPLVMRF